MTIFQLIEYDFSCSPVNSNAQYSCLSEIIKGRQNMGAPRYEKHKPNTKRPQGMDGKVSQQEVRPCPIWQKFCVNNIWPKYGFCSMLFCALPLILVMLIVVLTC